MFPAIDEIDLDREIIDRRGLLGFVEIAWDQVEVAPFVPGWHLEEMCEHLTAVTDGEIRNLLITVPPGCTKSLTICVFWPAWEWGPRGLPGIKYIFASYSANLSRRDAIRHRNLTDDPWYQARWPDGTAIPYQNTRSATDFANVAGGFRFSTSVKGGVTGRHADRLVFDDPIKPADTMGTRALTGQELDNVIDWWDNTMSTRQADPKTTARVGIMQRLHEKDLAGHCLDQGDYVHLRLPMEYEPKFHCVTKWGGDRRTEDNELLCPDRFPRPEVDRLKRSLGTRGTASQLQQRPTPAGGAIFLEEWFQYWGIPGSPHPELPKRHTKIQAWDFTFKGKPTGGRKRSYTSGMVWAYAAPNFFLVDMERGQWEFVQALAALFRLSQRWPDAHKKLIEDAANGPAIVNVAKRKLAGLKLVTTGGGSEARAQASAVFWESGNVWLPHPTIAPWVEDFKAELLAFPNGANDDMVDTSSHALVHLAQGVTSLYKSAMAQIGG